MKRARQMVETPSLFARQRRQLEERTLRRQAEQPASHQNRQARRRTLKLKTLER